MKISVNWLNDYIDLDLELNDLTDMLTAIGLEVEGVEYYEQIKGGLAGLIVGEVLSCKQHENADKLKVCAVDVGTEQLNIVCGAANVAAGQKVIVAPVGNTIHPDEAEPFTIGKVKLRGVESEGMICAEDEIGLGNSHEGIYVLPADAKVGTPVSQLFENYSDVVIEIGLTPNRPDAFSHIGVARDLTAAIQSQLGKDVKLKWPDVSSFKEGNGKPLNISVENLKACPRYSGVVIKDLKIGPSPKWLQNRLAAIGVKSISNVVDITNFINHELGQPLHAFDLAKVEGETIVVKNLPSNTAFTTLDDVERKLDSEDLMICNANNGMCIAGVYGGIGSGVTDDTTDIFLESAYFDPKTIRRTELRHDLRTDAATKFEKGIDPELQVYAAKRAALLMQELAGGTIASEVYDIYPEPFKPAEVRLTYKRLRTITGLEIRPAEVKNILNNLDFEIVEDNDDDLFVKVPLYRSDVTRPDDVIEEVLRIYGLNKVPADGKVSFSFTHNDNASDDLRNQISDRLSSLGLNEIITNAITRSSYMVKNNMLDEKRMVKPVKSQNAELDVLRPNMVVTGLEALAYNLNRQMSNCKFYEFGKLYERHNGAYREYDSLSIYLTGDKYEENWTQKESKVAFYDLKALVWAVLGNLINRELVTSETENNYFASGLMYKFDGKPLVEFGQLKKEVCASFDIKQDVFFADFDFNYLIELNNTKTEQFKDIPRFPSSRRDLALVLDNSVQYGEVKDLAAKAGGNNLRSVNLFDVFTDDEKIGKGKKSYAVSFLFRNDEQTITDSEIESAMQSIQKVLEKEVKAQVRN